MKKIIAIVLVVVLLLAAFAGCGEKDKDMVTVRLGIHRNAGGANLLGVAIQNKYFEEEGIKLEYTIVENGVAEMAAMRQTGRTLDIGYIGTGVSWNAMDPSGNGLKFVFFDCLGMAEYLVARKGQFEDTNKNDFYDLDEIYAGLKGKKVYMQTATTPGGWFKDLLTAINEGRPDSEKLWIYSETADYLKGYTAPNNAADCKVEVVDLENDKMPAAMSTSSSEKVDISVCFEPVPSTVIKQNKDVERIAGTDTHMPEKLALGSWVASEEWMKEDPETVQKVINALYKGSLKRAADPDAACRQGEIICQVPSDTFTPNVAVWPNAKNYAEWFKDTNAYGYEQFKKTYEAKKSAVPSGNPKAFNDCIDFTYMLKSIETIK